MIRRNLSWLLATSAALGTLTGCELIAGIETKDLAVGVETDAGDASVVTPIRIGMSSALSGTSGDLGTQMKRGIDACIARVNKVGGVNGRPLELVSKDDQYDPAKAEANVRELLDITTANPDPAQPDTRGPNSVIALLGNVGTPTMARTAPLAVKNKVPFFGAFTGSQAILREFPPNPYIFNYRAGYFDETRAMIAKVKVDSNNVLPPLSNIVVFAQGDAYGDAGYTGVKRALVAEGVTADPLRVNYTRDDLSTVPQAVNDVKVALQGADTTKLVTIIMIDTYQVGSTFTKLLRTELAQNTDTAELAARLRFMHVSFVGSEGLLEELKKPPATFTAKGAVIPFTRNVWVTQVVPSVDKQAPGIAEYREAMKELDPNGKLGFVSLEGNIACRLFVEGLKRANDDYSGDNLVKAFESLTSVDLAIGTPLSFGPQKHQASDQIWYSVFGKEDGTGDPLQYFIESKWSAKAGIETE